MRRYRIVNEWPSDRLKLEGFEKPDWVIYALVEPEGRVDGRLTPGTVRYVGKAIDANARFKRHMGQSRISDDRPVYKWIRKLTRQGLEPVLVIACHGKSQWDWQDAERVSIQQFGFDGENCHLLNLTPGGDGGSFELPHGETIRQKLSVSLKSSLRSKSHLARLHADPAWHRNVIAHITQLNLTQKQQDHLDKLNSNPELRSKRLAALARVHADPEQIVKRDERARANLTRINSDPALREKNKAHLARLNASPEQKAHIARLNALWAAARAARCKSIKEFKALLTSQASKTN